MASSSFTAILLLSLISSSMIYARLEPSQPEFVRQNQDGHGLLGRGSEDQAENVGTEHHETQSELENHSAFKSSDHGEYDDLTARYNAYRAAIHRQRLSGSNQGRKGMSDTRYLQNGRFFYDLEQERNKEAAKNIHSSDNKSNVSKLDNDDDEIGDDQFWDDLKKEFQKSSQNKYDP